MAAPPRKRARLSTDGNPASSTSSNNIPSLSNILQSFDHKVTTSLLLKAAKAHPSVSTLIQREYSRQIALDRTKVLNFDQFSKSAWEAINVRYAKLSSSRQFDTAPNAISQIERAIESIFKGCPKMASYDTKINALEALCQIGESICSGTEVIGSEVRKSFGSGKVLAKAMVGILNEMSEVEWEKVKSAAWVKQLEDVVELGKSYSILERLRKVLDVLEEDNKEDDEEGEEGQEDEDDEDEEEEESDESEDSEAFEARQAKDLEDLKTYALARYVLDGF